jgi:hypothetical protein
MSATQPGQIVYELDRQNRIYQIEGPWDRFLKENQSLNGGCEGLQKEQVLGRRLEPFINDDSTRMLFNTIFLSVRQTHRARRVEYRCDSPDEKRYMEMLIESLGNGMLRLTHSCLRTETITPAVLVTSAIDEVDAIRCSVCNRMEIEGAWMEPEVASVRESRDHFHVSYTVCPLCRHGLNV